MHLKSFAALAFMASLISGCSSMYYQSLESIGIPKRGVMVHRVEKARDTQEETKQQIQTTLEQFTALTHFNGGDLEATYKKLNSEYQDSVAQADQVHKRITDIEDVAGALFSEWEVELDQYSNASLRSSSQQQLRATQKQYQQLISAMKRAESKLPPVLTVFKDQVLFLKHNLNAQAISSLKEQLSSVQSDVSNLVHAMEQSINEANAFIDNLSPS